MLDSLPVPANRLRTTVLAVHRDGEHRFAKQTVAAIVLPPPPHCPMERV